MCAKSQNSKVLRFFFSVKMLDTKLCKVDASRELLVNLVCRALQHLHTRNVVLQSAGSDSLMIPNWKSVVVFGLQFGTKCNHV